MRRVPYAHGSLLAALDEHLSPPETIVIRGDREDLARRAETARGDYAPRRMVFSIPEDSQGLPEPLAAMRPGAKTRLYRCVGTRCEAPVEDPEEMGRVLRAD